MVKNTKHVPGLEQVLEPGPVSELPSVSVYSSVEWGDDGAPLHAVCTGSIIVTQSECGFRKGSVVTATQQTRQRTPYPLLMPVVLM